GVGGRGDGGKRGAGGGVGTLKGGLAVLVTVPPTLTVPVVAGEPPAVTIVIVPADDPPANWIVPSSVAVVPFCTLINEVESKPLLVTVTLAGTLMVVKPTPVL